MYPFLRLTKTIVQSGLSTLKGQTLSLTDVGELKLITNINDIDNFFEMNNGRIFTLFDLGRTDFAIRTGLGKKLIQKRWGLVVAGSTIQYRKRVRLLNQVTIKTRLIAVDERWFYLEQSMWVKGQATCSALIRAGVTNIKTGKTITTDVVMNALGYAGINMPPDAWVQAWIDADKLRPFPTAQATETTS